MNSKILSRFLIDLSQQRTKLGLTQVQVAEKMRVSYQSVNRWESGCFNTITLKHLIRYLEVLEEIGSDTIN